MNKATTASEWIDDVNTMLVTYSRNPEHVVAFAAIHGAIAGHWVYDAMFGRIVTEDGWTAKYDATEGCFVRA
jgi:hypothetical protein